MVKEAQLGFLGEGQEFKKIFTFHFLGKGVGKITLIGNWGIKTVGVSSIYKVTSPIPTKTMLSLLISLIVPLPADIFLPGKH